MYELLKKDGMAKRGRFHTVHGTIETPVFMNVGTAAAIKGAVSTDDLRQIKTQVELSNTYHLHVRLGDEIVKKNKYEIDMCNGSIMDKLISFSLPLMLSGILQLMFNAVDIVVVGRFSGSEALAAVGSTTALINVFTNLFIGISLGANVLAARFYASGKDEEMSETVHTSILLALISGIIMAFLGVIFARICLELMDTPEDVIDLSALYMRIYFLGMPAMALYNFGNAVCSAFGDTKKPLYYLGAAGIVNIVLNLFFVIVCKMDVAGVAAASIISQYLSAFLILRALVKVGGDYALRFSKLRFDKRMAGYLIQIGLPAGLQNGIFQVANLFIQAGVNTFDATMVAGNSAAANADALLYDSMAAFYTACGSFMGQNYGAGKRKRVRNSYLVSLAYSFGIGTIGGIALVIFGRQFLGLFTNDPAVVDAGMKRLTIMGFSYGFSAFMDSAIAASRALGKSVIPTVIVIIGSCIFRMVWVNTVFAYFKTIPSLYLLYIFSWGITAVVEIIYWVHVYRNTKIG